MSKDPKRYRESNGGNLPLKVVVNWHGSTSPADGPDAMGAAVGEKNGKFTQGMAARLPQPPIQLFFVPHSQFRGGPGVWRSPLEPYLIFSHDNK